MVLSIAIFLVLGLTVRRDYEKNFLIWLGCLIAFIVPVISVKADDVSYRIPSYKGHLSISDNSSATLRRKLLMIFESDYHGQYVTLGSAKTSSKWFLH